MALKKDLNDKIKEFEDDLSEDGLDENELDNNILGLDEDEKNSDNESQQNDQEDEDLDWIFDDTDDDNDNDSMKNKEGDEDESYEEEKDEPYEEDEEDESYDEDGDNEEDKKNTNSILSDIDNKNERFEDLLSDIEEEDERESKEINVDEILEENEEDENDFSNKNNIVDVDNEEDIYTDEETEEENEGNFGDNLGEEIDNNTSEKLLGDTGTFINFSDIGTKLINKINEVLIGEEDIIKDDEKGTKHNEFKRLLDAITDNNVKPVIKKNANSIELELGQYEFEDLEKRINTFLAMPYSFSIGLDGLTLKDDISAVDIKDLDPAFRKFTGYKGVIKSFFYWKNRFIILKDGYLQTNYFEKIIKGFLKKGDTDSVVVGYDLIDNKLIVKPIKDLLHFAIYGESQSGKTVLSLSIMLQMLIKGKTELMFMEKATDSDFYFKKHPKFIYKASLDNLKAETIIIVFTLITLIIQQRSQMYTKIGGADNIYEYNKKLQEMIDNGEDVKAKGLEHIGYFLFGIDEFQAIRLKIARTFGGKDADQRFINNLISVLNVARSYGVHILLATQTPKSDGIDRGLLVNLRTKIAGKITGAQYIDFIKDAGVRSLMDNSKLSLGDFVGVIGTNSYWSVFRSFMVSKELFQKLIDEGIIEERDEKDKEFLEKYGVEKASKLFAMRKIDELLEYLGLDIAQTMLLKKYGIDVNTLMSINSIQKYSLIILGNLLFKWYEKQAERIRKGLSFISFDIGEKIQKLLEDETYLGLSFLLFYTENIYKNHMERNIKSIKLKKPKDDMELDENLHIAAEEIISVLNDTIEHYKALDDKGKLEE